MQPTLLVGLALSACAGVSSKPLLDQGRDRLLSGSESAIAGVLHDEVDLGGVWSADPSCARFASATVVRDADQRAQLARCLGALHLRAGTRASAFPDLTTVTTPSGVELEAAFIKTGGTARLRYLGYVGRISEQDAQPTITQQELERHRRPGAVAIDTAAIERDLADHKLPLATTWLRLCIDAAGAVTSVRPRSTSSVVAQRLFVEAAARWTFDPVILDGQPTPVCAMVAVGHPRPPDGLALPFPVPPDHADRVVITLELAGALRRGHPVEAGRSIRQYMRHERIAEIRTPILACFDETGAVDEVVLLGTSGVAPFDRTVVTQVREWKFAPLVVDGAPIRACVTHLVVHWEWLESNITVVRDEARPSVSAG